MAKLTFHGGALSVTGANYLIETKKSKVIIDCGMFQGGKRCDEINYRDFAYDVSSVDAALITHAHIDHIGRLPKLIRDGFSGAIYATGPTADLAAIMLEDSQGLIARECKKKREILYSMKDVRMTVKYFHPVEYGDIIEVTPDIRVRFRDAGHILGSSIIEVWVKEGSKETKIVFSGDLGNPPTPLLKPTEYIDEADYVLVESVYGDRIHEDREKRKELLENAIEDTITQGGVLMVPSFAIERTQEILFELNGLVENSRIPKIPIFIDSPMAIDATAVYQKYPLYFNREAIYLIKSGDDLFKFPNLKYTYKTAQSKAINDVPPPKVIIAGSGMSTGGRIVHHEMRYLPDPKSMLLIIGYQAHGTLGRRILNGATEVKIHGQTIPVLCKIRAIGGYSAHADQDGLYHWVDRIREGGSLKRVYCIQGEEKAAHALATRISDYMAIDAEVPNPGDFFEF